MVSLGSGRQWLAVVNSMFEAFSDMNFRFVVIAFVLTVAVVPLFVFLVMIALGCTF